MYYILGHFSKFITPDSTRVLIKIDGFGGKSNDQLEAVAFNTPDNHYVIVLHNKEPIKSFNVALGIGEQPEDYINIKIDAKSIKTIIVKG
jgi:hypothetical protein